MWPPLATNFLALEKMFGINPCVMSNRQSTPLSPIWAPWAVVVALECIRLQGFSYKPLVLFKLANMSSSGNQFSCPWKMFGMNACVMSNQVSTTLSPIWEPWSVVVALECIHLWSTLVHMPNQLTKAILKNQSYYRPKMLILYCLSKWLWNSKTAIFSHFNFELENLQVWLVKVLS
jgi:hypothetical protein